MGRCSLDLHRCTVPRSFGRRPRRRRPASSFGWLSTSDVGQRIGVSGIAFNSPTLVLSVTRRRRRWITCYAAAVSLGKPGTSGFLSCICAFRAPEEEESAIGWWLMSRKLIPKTLRQGFDSFFMLMGWILWKERNARMFNGLAMNVVQLTDAVEAKARQWCLAVLLGGSS